MARSPVPEPRLTAEEREAFGRGVSEFNERQFFERHTGAQVATDSAGRQCAARAEGDRGSRRIGGCVAGQDAASETDQGAGWNSEHIIEQQIFGGTVGGNQRGVQRGV